MLHLELAKRLFDWIAKNLVFDAELKKEEISYYFAESFVVIANGKKYEANYGNYFEFLQSFRSSIRKISHELGEVVEDGKSVAIPMNLS